MKAADSNRQKNLLFLHIFGFASLLHILLNSIFTFNAAVIAPFFRAYCLYPAPAP